MDKTGIDGLDQEAQEQVGLKQKVRFARFLRDEEGRSIILSKEARRKFFRKMGLLLWLFLLIGVLIGYGLKWFIGC